MTYLNPNSGADTGLPIDLRRLLDAEDLISEAKDFANMISLAFRERRDPDSVSVTVVADRLLGLLTESWAFMREFRDGLQNGR